MASENKTTKADLTPKADPAPKADPVPKADLAPKTDASAKTKSTSGEDKPKAEGGDTAAAAPSNYSRGEGQKPVTRAYKENWNAIFAKKAAKKKKR